MTAGVEFHSLAVADVAELTDDAVAVTFDVPDRLAETFRFLPGQHVVVRASIDGEDVRRTYSVCADASTGSLRVGIKRIPGGVFSTFATTRLSAGDTLEVMPPIGDFTITPDPSARRHRCAIVAGSGITPVLSQISTTLRLEPASRWTVIFGNRDARSVMFLDELEGLKNRYGDRLHLIHVLSREDTVPLLSGRVDHERLHGIFSNLVAFSTVEEWYLCGPVDMVESAREFIEGHGVAASRIHQELFFTDSRPERLIREEDTTGSVTLTFTLDGRSSTVRMEPEQTVLDAALTVRSELPFSCRGGMCATCKTKILRGDATMDKNWSLVEDDLAQRFTLACQAHPTTTELVVDFDQR